MAARAAVAAGQLAAISGISTAGFSTASAGRRASVFADELAGDAAFTPILVAAALELVEGNGRLALDRQQGEDLLGSGMMLRLVTFLA